MHYVFILLPHMRITAEIRKIQYGLIPKEPILAVQVGSRAAGKEDCFITEIIEDKDSLLEYGNIDYLIFVSKNGKKENQFLWKRYNKMPDFIEYFFTDNGSQTIIL